MNHAGSHDGYRDMFSRGTLELTFKILRKRRPALALRIQNAMVGAYGRGDYHTGLTAAELPLGADVVEEIVQALSSLSDQIIANGETDRTELVLTRSLLLDWLMFARERVEPGE
jgi:hypothetical protein